jgi:hypothetical protein
MPLLTIVIVLIVVGVLLALVNRYGPPYIDGKFVTFINVVCVIATIIWLLKVFGIWEYLSKVTA